jgi:hypothetical protein
MMKMMMIVVLTILVLLSHCYHSFMHRTGVSLHHHHEHYYHYHYKNQYKKMIRLYNSNIYISDGLPLINNINVVNIGTNQEVNFLSYINSKTNNDDIINDNQKTLIILGDMVVDEIGFELLYLLC